MNKCVFAGCFDPFTIGHKDVVERLSRMFDKVYVVVSNNAEKKLALDGNVRHGLVKKCIDEENVEVVLNEGLLVDFCRANEVDCVVKGVRNVADFDYENLQAKVNKALGDVETLFLPCADSMAFISSSFVKELISLGKDVSQYVPQEIAEDVEKLYRVKKNKI